MVEAGKTLLECIDVMQCTTPHMLAMRTLGVTPLPCLIAEEQVSAHTPLLYSTGLQQA